MLLGNPESRCRVRSKRKRAPLISSLAFGLYDAMRPHALLGLIAALALFTTGCDKAPAAHLTVATSNEQFRTYILEHPEVVEEALSKLQARRQAAGATDGQVRLSMEQNWKKLDHDPRDFVAGNPNGRITVVEFFDYNCPYCKAALFGHGSLETAPGRGARPVAPAAAPAVGGVTRPVRLHSRLHCPRTDNSSGCVVPLRPGLL